MKIAITVNMSIAFWTNGMQQNIVFLYEILKKAGHDCYYITQNKPSTTLSLNHKGMMLDDLLSDKNEVFDIVLVCGFELLPNMYSSLKKRSSKTKFILIHYGNKLLDDMHHGLTGPESVKTPVNVDKFKFDQIWTSPHYGFALNYIKAYHQNENVKICPYIWGSYFVDKKIEFLKSKNLNPYFDKNAVNQVCIFEPNRTTSKNCLIPVMITERFNQIFGNELKSVNVFCCEKIRERKFFKEFIKSTQAGKRKEFMFFNNRWGSLEAFCKFGKTLISHQVYNELNYSHLEAMYLDMPVIHNSKLLMDYGYFYPEFDVDMGAKQIKNVLLNHYNNIGDYKKDVKKLLHKFSCDNIDNINAYSSMLDE
jgi:hypothetical protein